MDITDIDTLWLDTEKQCICAIDQTLLPGETKIISLKFKDEIWEAIFRLRVRGAPAIGVCAAMGMYLLSSQTVNEENNISYEDFYRIFKDNKDYLNSSRPTAVNLSWALERMEKVVTDNSDKAVPEIVELLLEEAVSIRNRDVEVCEKIGEYGLSLVKKGDGILTHCNAGKLCAVRLGTATAPIYLGEKKGYGFKVYADETRPLLQGARLTAYELLMSGVDVTLICDNMSATVMRKGLINAVFVGCDRVAANGDVANKIGTSMVAMAAKNYGIPFYVCAPTATIDVNTPSGDSIVIEERDGDEITDMWYEKRMAPAGVKTFNPAFDITDNSLVTAIITEKGIFRAPYNFTEETIG